MSIMKTYLDGKVEARSDTHRKTNSDRLRVFLDAFLVDGGLSDDNPLTEGSDDYLGKIYAGRESLPNECASYYIARLDSASFAEFCGDLTVEAREGMAQAFTALNESVDVDHLEENITSVLQQVLTYIINVRPSDSIRSARFIGNNQVVINGKTLNLPQALIPSDTDIQPKENKYVDALLEVYAQDAGSGQITLADLQNMHPRYRKHFKLQRQNFYSAESVLHQVRDIFSDAEAEFNTLKQETLAGIQGILLAKHKNALDRVEKTLVHVTILQYGRSYLAQPGTGLIGAEEKQGVIHMLVNDGKIEWVVDYDEDIQF